MLHLSTTRVEKVVLVPRLRSVARVETVVRRAETVVLPEEEGTTEAVARCQEETSLRLEVEVELEVTTEDKRALEAAAVDSKTFRFFLLLETHLLAETRLRLHLLAEMRLLLDLLAATRRLLRLLVETHLLLLHLMAETHLLVETRRVLLHLLAETRLRMVSAKGLGKAQAPGAQPAGTGMGKGDVGKQAAPSGVNPAGIGTGTGKCQSSAPAAGGTTSASVAPAVPEGDKGGKPVSGKQDAPLQHWLKGGSYPGPGWEYATPLLGFGGTAIPGYHQFQNGKGGLETVSETEVAADPAGGFHPAPYGPHDDMCGFYGYKGYKGAMVPGWSMKGQDGIGPGYDYHDPHCQLPPWKGGKKASDWVGHAWGKAEVDSFGAELATEKGKAGMTLGEMEMKGKGAVVMSGSAAAEPAPEPAASMFGYRQHRFPRPLGMDESVRTYPGGQGQGQLRQSRSSRYCHGFGYCHGFETSGCAPHDKSALLSALDRLTLDNTNTAAASGSNFPPGSTMAAVQVQVKKELEHVDPADANIPKPFVIPEPELGENTFQLNYDNTNYKMTPQEKGDLDTAEDRAASALYSQLVDEVRHEAAVEATKRLDGLPEAGTATPAAVGTASLVLAPHPPQQDFTMKNLEAYQRAKQQSKASAASSVKLLSELLASRDSNPNAEEQTNLVMGSLKACTALLQKSSGSPPAKRKKTEDIAQEVAPMEIVEDKTAT
eukprot:g3279.t1